MGNPPRRCRAAVTEPCPGCHGSQEGALPAEGARGKEGGWRCSTPGLQLPTRALGGSVGGLPFLDGRVCLGQGRRWACRGLWLFVHSHT